MTITLTPAQQAHLEAAVASGQFASIEEAVRFAVERLILDAEFGDLSWVRPYLDEARAEVERGETISLDEFNAHVEKRLARLR